MRDSLNQVLETLPERKVKEMNIILQDKTLIPKKEKIFNGYNISVEDLKFIIVGESPYPREESATGHAFIDGGVKNIWSSEGLSKEVNKATSLRNLFKTALVADGFTIPEKTRKQDIKKIENKIFVQTMTDLHRNLNNNGVALLNMCLSLRGGKVNASDVLLWENIMDRFLLNIVIKNPNVILVLWGNIAKRVKKLNSFSYFQYIESEHPYNNSFIDNKKMQHFLKEINFLY